MSVEFENDYRPTTQFTQQGFPGQQSGRGMAGWLVKKGIINDESQAKGILVGVVCFNFLAMAVIFYIFVF